MAKTTLKFKREFIGNTLRLFYEVFNNNSTTNYLFFNGRVIKIEYLPFFFDIAKYKKNPTYPSGASDKDKDTMYEFFQSLYDAIEYGKPTDNDDVSYLFSPLYDFTSYAPVATITCVIQTGGLGFLRFFAPNYNVYRSVPKELLQQDFDAYVARYQVEAFNLTEEISKSGRELKYEYINGTAAYLVIIYLSCFLNLFAADARNVRKGYDYTFGYRGTDKFQMLPFIITKRELDNYYDDGEEEVKSIINDLIFISSSAAQIQINKALESAIEKYNYFTETRFPSLQVLPTALLSITFEKDRIDNLVMRFLENTQWFTTAYLNFVRRTLPTTGREIYNQSFEKREITEKLLVDMGGLFEESYTYWKTNNDSIRTSKYINNPLELFKDFKIKNTKTLDVFRKGDYIPTYYIEKYFAEERYTDNTHIGSITEENPLATNGYQVANAGYNLFQTDPIVRTGDLSPSKYSDDERVSKEEAVKLADVNYVYGAYIARSNNTYRILPQKGDIVALYNLPLILSDFNQNIDLNLSVIGKIFPDYQRFKTGVDYIDKIYFENSNDVSASIIAEAMYFQAMRGVFNRNGFSDLPFNAFEKCFAVITEVDTESFNVLTDTITCETLVPIGAGKYAIAEFKAAYYNNDFYSQNLSSIRSIGEYEYAINSNNNYSDTFRLNLFINLVNTCQNNFIIPVNQADVFEEVNRNNKLKNIAGTWELKKAGGIVDVQEFVKTYKNVKVDALESQKILDKMFDSKYKDTEVYKYFSLNLGKLFDLYKADKKGTKEILKSLNALAKYEKECIVGGELPKKEKSQIRNLIDNI
tara:strand:+ start:114 stop:2546 length:2433 start_codon:yes stop_codon:yes gene_type:complete